jgi:ring-1,2-phenylacetyl-CoA epoxidase subunit PaaC
VNDVATYALRLGDDALIMAQRLSEWSSNAPEIEEDIALTNIALDLLGQARSLLTYAGTPDGRTEDDLAYLRGEREFVNCQLVEQPCGDFAVTITRQLFFATYQLALYERLIDSADDTIAGVAAKAAKEASYHRDHATQWTMRLGDGTDESHRRMQAACESMWPYTHELFESDELVRAVALRRIAVDPPSLRAEWSAYVGGILAEATLTRPEDGWAPSGGRRGLHTECFGFLLAEMQHLNRSHPGATW